jgi:hypothetical protein
MFISITTVSADLSDYFSELTHRENVPTQYLLKYLISSAMDQSSTNGALNVKLSDNLSSKLESSLKVRFKDYSRG